MPTTGRKWQWSACGVDDRPSAYRTDSKRQYFLFKHRIICTGGKCCRVTFAKLILRLRISIVSATRRVFPVGATGRQARCHVWPTPNDSLCAPVRCLDAGRQAHVHTADVHKHFIVEGCTAGIINHRVQFLGFRVTHDQPLRRSQKTTIIHSPMLPVLARRYYRHSSRLYSHKYARLTFT